MFSVHPYRFKVHAPDKLCNNRTTGTINASRFHPSSKLPSSKTPATCKINPPSKPFPHFPIPPATLSPILPRSFPQSFSQVPNRKLAAFTRELSRSSHRPEIYTLRASPGARVLYNHRDSPSRSVREPGKMAASRYHLRQNGHASSGHFAAYEPLKSASLFFQHGAFHE